MTIQAIIEYLRSNSACSLMWTEPKISPPQFLPDDIRQFFSHTTGGHHFFDPDHANPQFGCRLELSNKPVSQDSAFVDYPVCIGPEFDHLFPIAYYDNGFYYDIAGVSVLSESYGNIFSLSFALGDPEFNWSAANFMARSFTRWLEMHIEAWEIYQEDWREGLRHFRKLLDDEEKYNSRS